MLKRRYLFPNVIEMNYQAGRRLGVNVYLIHDGDEYVLIDIGYDETVSDIVDMIRRMDFPLSACKMLIATHADVDHSQGLRRASELLKAPVAAHPKCVAALESGDTEITFARIKAQDIDIPMPRIAVQHQLDEGSQVRIGRLTLDVWSTPGHAEGQLAFKMNDLLFVGDNIYRDGSVGVIDAHHGSNLPQFIASLERILADNSVFWLPSHGPVFRRDDELIRQTIQRLTGYQFLADFGTCAVGWPLLREWEAEVTSGRLPDFATDASNALDPAAAAPPTSSGRGKSKRLPGALS